MISRREALQTIGVGGMSAALLSSGALAAAAGQGTSGTRVLAIYDARLLDASAFARGTVGAGQRPIAIRGDFAAMLYDVLPAAIDAAPDGALGLTSYSDYLVAAGIAREHGVTLVGALLRERGSARTIAGSAPELQRRARAVGCVDLARLSESRGKTRQTSVLWALA